MSSYRGSQRPHSRPRGGGSSPKIQVFFDPAKSDVDLFDALAEEQAELMPGDRNTINANQLRKYFGEIKDLYRQFKARTASCTDAEAAQCYIESFEARFKMIRSKVAYGQRASGSAKLTQEFSTLISEGIGKVRNGNHKDFERFVMHLEAVVGFMYGKGKVSS